MPETNSPPTEANIQIPHLRPFRSLRADPRFSYAAYVPAGFSDSKCSYRLLVAAHGSGRDALEVAEKFIELADSAKYVVLAPLFPVGPSGNDDGDGYKYLAEPGIDYITILDQCIQELEEALDHKFGRLAMFGMSGGAQFVQRYSLIRPQRVAAASIASPGTVTLPGAPQDWWVGTGNLAELFGADLDLEALRQIQFHLQVGSLDLDKSEILPRRQSKYMMADAGIAGETRVDRTRALHQQMVALGLDPRFEIVGGAAHQLEPLQQRAVAFFRSFAATPEEELFNGEENRNET